jgi:hypothetical protein
MGQFSQKLDNLSMRWPVLFALNALDRRKPQERRRHFDIASRQELFELRTRREVISKRADWGGGSRESRGRLAIPFQSSNARVGCEGLTVKPKSNQTRARSLGEQV